MQSDPKIKSILWYPFREISETHNKNKKQNKKAWILIRNHLLMNKWQIENFEEGRWPKTDLRERVWEWKRMENGEILKCVMNNELFPKHMGWWDRDIKGCCCSTVPMSGLIHYVCFYSPNALNFLSIAELFFSFVVVVRFS